MPPPPPSKESLSPSSSMRSTNSKKRRHVSFSKQKMVIPVEKFTKNKKALWFTNEECDMMLDNAMRAANKPDHEETTKYTKRGLEALIGERYSARTLAKQDAREAAEYQMEVPRSNTIKRKVINFLRRPHQRG